MAIAFDAVTARQTTTATSLGFSHTCAGSDRALAVVVRVNNVSDILTGVTYNGVPMAEGVKVQNTTDNWWQYIYYLEAPATGSNTVTISLSGSAFISGSASSYTGVRQSGGVDGNASVFETASGSRTVSVTTSEDNAWLVSSCYLQTAAPTANVNGIRRGTLFHDEPSDSNADLTPAGAHTIGYNWDVSDRHTILAIGMAPVSVSAQITKDGNARIEIQDSITKTGNSRILINDTEEVYDAEARITVPFQKTSTGNSRMDIINSLDKTGNASLNFSIDKTGNASLDLAVKQITKDGESRIEIQNIITKTGAARIQIDDTEKTSDGNARIEIQNTITKDGNANIILTSQLQKTSDGNASLNFSIDKTGNASISRLDTFKPTINAINSTKPSFRSAETFN